MRVFRRQRLWMRQCCLHWAVPVLNSLLVPVPGIWLLDPAHLAFASGFCMASLTPPSFSAQHLCCPGRGTQSKTSLLMIRFLEKGGLLHPLSLWDLCTLAVLSFPQHSHRAQESTGSRLGQNIFMLSKNPGMLPWFGGNIWEGSRNYSMRWMEGTLRLEKTTLAQESLVTGLHSFWMGLA